MEYSSNANEVILRINAKLKKASDVSLLQHNIAAYLYDENWGRITEGKAVNETPIGKYSSKPMYLNPKKAPRKFTGAIAGKYGEVKFKNGKPHKTKYFIGYKGYRINVGRQVAVVDLQLTKKLFKDWRVQQDGKDWIIGFQTKYGSDISRGNEARFKKMIWGISKTAYKRVQKIEEDFINNALK